MIKGNCSFHFGIYLYQQNVLPFGRMLSLVSCYLLFKAGFLSIKKLHEATFKRFFSGLSAFVIDYHATQFISQKLQHLLFLPAFQKLQEAKEAGGYTAILSSSPDFLVKKIADQWSVDIWDATVYQKNACHQFSHIVQFMEGETKADTLRQLMEKLQICKNEVIAYSDSYLDLPFLHAAGQPIGVKPDRRLRAICLQNHWPIIE